MTSVAVQIIQLGGKAQAGQAGEEGDAHLARQAQAVASGPGAGAGQQRLGRLGHTGRVAHAGRGLASGGAYRYCRTKNPVCNSLKVLKRLAMSPEYLKINSAQAVHQLSFPYFLRADRALGAPAR